MDTAEAWGPNLPLAEFDFAQDEARALVDAFDQVRVRARGLPAAPTSWLPGPGEKLAGALLELAITPDADRAMVTTLKEGIVDLQAFIPDEDAEAAQRLRAGSPWDAPDRLRGRRPWSASSTPRPRRSAGCARTTASWAP